MRGYRPFFVLVLTTALALSPAVRADLEYRAEITGAEDGDRHAIGWHLAEHPFLGRAAEPPERRPLRNGQPSGGADLGDLTLDDRREREIKVVAAKEQVIADRHAFEGRRTRFDSDPDQTEIGRATSDIADECNLFVFERN